MIRAFSAAHAGARRVSAARRASSTAEVSPARSDAAPAAQWRNSRRASLDDFRHEVETRRALPVARASSASARSLSVTASARQISACVVRMRQSARYRRRRPRRGGRPVRAGGRVPRRAGAQFAVGYWPGGQSRAIWRTVALSIGHGGRRRVFCGIAASSIRRRSRKPPALPGASREQRREMRAHFLPAAGEIATCRLTAFSLASTVPGYYTDALFPFF